MLRAMSQPLCAICKKPIERRPANPFYPFCSERCRLLDFGKWIGGEYRVPGPPIEREGGVPSEREDEGGGEDGDDPEHW
jgi:endogenous inhibitor of DNA gyrase (YacG/DUF329 family)